MEGNGQTKAVTGEWLGHPKGLFILFLVEMWERFSYYGMRALLTLFLVETIEGGGWGWSNAEAFALYGTYTMMVYLMGIPGGILADKVFGQKRMVMIGGVLLCIGHGILALEGEVPFYLGLIFIVLGVGGLKPNISTMVGGLYKQGDVRRDKGFTIFYMGINLGAFLAAIIVGTVGEVYGWHYGFGLAGIGMVIGQLTFVWGLKFLDGVGDLVKEEKSATEPQHNLFQDLLKEPVAMVISLLIIVAGSGYFGYSALSDGALSSWLFAALMVFAGLFVGLAIVAIKELDEVEKDRVIVMFVAFLIVIVFWGAFEQAGGLMNIYTDQNVDRNVEYLGIAWLPEIPASNFQSLNALFIIMFGVVVANFWRQRRNKNKEESAIFKMAIGNMIMGTGFIMMYAATIEEGAVGKASMYWVVLAYLLHTIGELCSSPVALSFITKLAPVKYASIMMGIYFAMTGLGNKLAGLLGESSAALGEQAVFLMIAVFSVLFGLLLMLFLKKLKKLTHGAEEVDPSVR